ncbi:MAG: hypothetical protein IEMM0002_0828 [bacterium]|nr:MAG: hypothetical protein IEMM0002_0828 [bacterium]
MKIFNNLLLAGLFFFGSSAFAQNEDARISMAKNVTLFFDEDGSLKPEMRKITPEEFLEFEIRSVVEQLIHGSSRYSRTVPETARLNRVFLDRQNVVYLDFNSEFVKDHPGGVACEIITLASIARTIFANFDVNSIRILSGGKELKTLAGHIDLRLPFTRMEVQKWVAQSRK